MVSERERQAEGLQEKGPSLHPSGSGPISVDTPGNSPAQHTSLKHSASFGTQKALEDGRRRCEACPPPSDQLL